MTYAKEWPYYSKKNKQIHIVTLNYYSNVRSKHENIHKILEKTADCEPYELPRQIQ